MNGLITLASKYPVKETLDRLAATVQQKGLHVFARIDHAANATEVGMPLRPTELIIFGNPKAGTVLMQDQQSAGLDLPLHALAWQDEQGQVWLTYSDAQWIAERYGLSEKSRATVRAINEGMKAVCEVVLK
ncbi:MAG: DUF302 domain-containing protein [Flavipsychrobacter sp.]